MCIRLAVGRVLLIGAGGLGSPVALALTGQPAAADSAATRVPLSVLTLVDPDVVELSNLHRQLLHGDRDLGRRKVDSAADRLTARMPAGFFCERLAVRLDADCAPALIGTHDLVIEGSDDLATKFLVNDVARRLGVPAVIGGVVRFSGQIVTVMPTSAHKPLGPRELLGSSVELPPDSPVDLPIEPPPGCYRCLFEEPPEPGLAATCQQAGVLGPACGLVGGLMAAEAVRILTGVPPLYAGVVLTLDLLRWRLRRVPFGPRPGCPACAASYAT